MSATELADAAGLAVDNGIAVDAALRTSDPNIFALGDCASYPNAHTGARTRLESVQNATDQARHMARTILNTHPAGEQDYDELPWFWSQQDPHKLQIAGLAPAGDETVLRGDPTADNFSVFCYHNGILAAVESINRPDHMAARRLLATGRAWHRNRQQTKTSISSPTPRIQDRLSKWSSFRPPADITTGLVSVSELLEPYAAPTHSLFIWPHYHDRQASAVAPLALDRNLSRSLRHGLWVRRVRASGFLVVG